MILVLALMLAATPLSEVRVSPDTTVTLGPTVGDEEVALDDFTSVVPVSVGGIPFQADLDAYALLPNGDQLLSVDTTVVLSSGGTAHPGDVWRYRAGSYSVELDAAARGVPDGADLDAVAAFPGALLLSFDVALDVGVHAEPEDLVRFDASGFGPFFDGSAAGVPAGLDLDAADYVPCNGHLLLSFDGSGTIGGVDFDDEDVLEFDRVSTWSMAYDGSAEIAGWVDADLDAVQAKVDYGAGVPAPFGQTVTAGATKTSFQWGSVVPFRMVRGPFTSSTSIGAYAASGTTLATANTFSDAAVPAPGTGTWYLVKPGGCGPTTWQSALGLEPGRDLSIP